MNKSKQTPAIYAYRLVPRKETPATARQTKTRDECFFRQWASESGRSASDPVVWRSDKKHTLKTRLLRRNGGSHLSHVEPGDIVITSVSLLGNWPFG